MHKSNHTDLKFDHHEPIVSWTWSGDGSWDWGSIPNGDFRNYASQSESCSYVSRLNKEGSGEQRCRIESLVMQFVLGLLLPQLGQPAFLRCSSDVLNVLVLASILFNRPRRDKCPVSVSNGPHDLCPFGVGEATCPMQGFLEEALYMDGVRRIDQRVVETQWTPNHVFCLHVPIAASWSVFQALSFSIFMHVSIPGETSLEILYGRTFLLVSKQWLLFC